MNEDIIAHAVGLYKTHSPHQYEFYERCEELARQELITKETRDLVHQIFWGPKKDE